MNRTILTEDRLRPFERKLRDAMASKPTASNGEISRAFGIRVDSVSRFRSVFFASGLLPINQLKDKVSGTLDELNQI